MKKSVMFAGTVVCAIALTAGTAGAHFCTNGKRSDQANQQVAAHSSGWATYADLLVEEFGMCEAGLIHVRTNTPSTIDLDVPTHAKTVLAQGTFRSGNQAQGISYLDAPDADWDAFDVAIEEGFELCGSAA